MSARISSSVAASVQRGRGILEGGIEVALQTDEERFLRRGGAPNQHVTDGGDLQPQARELVAEEVGDSASFDHAARIGREPIEGRLDGPGHAGPQLGGQGSVRGILGRSRLQGSPQHGPRTVGGLRDGVLEQLGQELLVGRRGAVLAEQPGAGLNELAHLQRRPAVPFVDARGERDSLAVERAP